MGIGVRWTGIKLVLTSEHDVAAKLDYKVHRFQSTRGKNSAWTVSSNRMRRVFVGYYTIETCDTYGYMHGL